MGITQNDDMIQALAANRSDQPFGEAVLPRRGWRVEKSDHFVSSGDSIASSTRTGFSVHTVAACRTSSYNPRWAAAAVQEHVIAFEQTHCPGGTSH
jgi:hypothetical protein